VYMGLASVQLTGGCRPAVFKGHTLIGDALNNGEPLVDAYPDNIQLLDKVDGWPTTPKRGIWTFVRGHPLRTAKAHPFVYNWAQAPVIDVDLPILGIRPGALVTIRDAQAFFANPPLVQTTYRSQPVRIPMANRRVASPVGSVPAPPQPS